MARYMLPAMRVAIGITAVLGLVIWALWTPDSVVRLNEADPPPAQQKSPSPLGEGRGEGIKPPAPLVAHVTAAANPAANIPSSLPAPVHVPQTLELVSLPTLSGGAKATPRNISRAEAVASVIASREFQDTVSPL